MVHICVLFLLRFYLKTMGFSRYFMTLLVMAASVNAEAWSWNNGHSHRQHAKEEHLFPPESKTVPEHNTNQNATNVDLVIDAILSLKPQGNNTNIDNELYKSMIRDKLCSLGFRTCGLKSGKDHSTATKTSSHEETSSSTIFDNKHIISTPQIRQEPPRKQYPPSKSYTAYHDYHSQYKHYQIPQKHIHHHFHYNKLGNIYVPLITDSGDQAIAKKTPSFYGISKQVRSNDDGFKGYFLGTTSPTMVTSEPLNKSTGHPIQSGKLEEKNIDCICLPTHQCQKHDVLGGNENHEHHQLPLDPRRLERGMHGPEKAGIRVLIDKYGKMNIISVPNRYSLIRQANGRPKRQPRGKKEPKDIFGHLKICGPKEVCCRKSLRSKEPEFISGQCGIRNPEGISGRIKNPSQIEGDSDFGEYPWQVAILKRGPEESSFICGGTLINSLYIITAAHCVKQYKAEDLKVRLGEWEVNHHTEFFSYVESDITTLLVHPNFYAGTLHNDLAILRMEKAVDLNENPHISAACLPSPHKDFTGTTCWTTGWGKDAFGENGKYQNILQEIDVPIVGHKLCQTQLQNTRLGLRFKLHPGFICAGGEGKDACKGDGGGPMVCERGGVWNVVGIVSWGIGCGQIGVPGVYVNVAHYLEWIELNTRQF